MKSRNGREEKNTLIISKIWAAIRKVPLQDNTHIHYWR